LSDNLPIGIARIRHEWLQSGALDDRAPVAQEQPVIFPEAEGGVRIGDYTIEEEEVRTSLALSQEAIDRIIASGELDSIKVRDAAGTVRRLVSESSLRRFQIDSAIEPISALGQAVSDTSIQQAIEELQLEVGQMRNTSSKIIQQMKDILLLEIRNLKEQDRDLASFVYELAEEIRKTLPRKRR
jgi:hypothetical protein